MQVLDYFAMAAEIVYDKSNTHSTTIEKIKNKNPMWIV